ncbi:MAG: DUF2793 domain-containing protein [Brevundimonas sp.]|nr:DUF2793 domain-containing protein [Brevundimonas sp.]
MSDDQSARLGLPYLAAGQLQKHVTLNEALTRLDTLVQTTVVSRSLAVEPADAPEGALYILPEGVVGEVWETFAPGDLVRAEISGWVRVAAPDGALVRIADETAFVVGDGAGWTPLGGQLGAVGPLDRLGLGTDADAENPFAAKLNKALWTALEAAAGGDGDLRLTLNKEATPDVLSILFQSGYVGRAELGLIGGDDLALKVSADGATWRTAFSVDRTSGRVSFADGAGRRETTMVTTTAPWSPPAWARTVEAVVVGGGGGGGAGAFGASGARYGGGGGGAGGVSRAVWPADQLSAGLTAVIGEGGAGGNASAGGGGSGSLVYLGSTMLICATGGGGGGLGTASTGAGGSAGAGTPNSNAGGSSSVTGAGGAGRAFDRPDAPGGGGAGGGLDAGGVARSGGPGGDGGVLAVKAVGGAGGSGSGGATGAAAPLPQLHWAGAGGGGGGAATSGAGHAGAAGGLRGAGGGGGGAGVSAGGAGGAGASGTIWLTAIG